MITAQENHFTNRWWEEVEERFKCSHEQEQVVRYQKSNGVWCVRRQCLNCGEYTTSDLPQKSINIASLPVFDASIRDACRQAKQKARQEAKYKLLSESEMARLSHEQRWLENVNRYYATEHWKQLRCTVLLRDGHKCQNCFCAVTEATAHIHHLSYTGLDRVGKSFAFECVTLCRKCHVDFTPRMQQWATT